MNNNHIIKSELLDIKHDLEKAFIEANYTQEISFKSFSIDPKNIKIQGVYDPKLKNDFLKNHLRDKASEILNIKKPVVYYFTFNEDLTNKEVVNLLGELYCFKQGEGKKIGTFPKILKKYQERDERVLYVGCKKTLFSSRVCEHLGYCNKSTQGLNLFHWPENLKRALTFSYAELDVAIPLTVTLIEQALHKKLKPLIGDAPYYG